MPRKSLLALLLFPCAMFGQVAFVNNEAHGTPAGSPYTTTAVTPTAGNASIIAFDEINDVTPTSCVCGSNTYTKAIGGACGSSAAGWVQLWRATNLVAGSCTPTCTFPSTPSNGEIQYTEWSGADTTAMMDAVSTCATGTSADPLGSSVAVNGAGEAVYAWAGSSGNAAYTAGSGYTLLNVDGFTAGEYKTGNSTAQTPGYTKVSSTWVVVSLSIKQAAAGGGCPKTLKTLGVGCS